MPSHVLAAPLLRENAEKRRGEAEHETGEPQRVDCHYVWRSFERRGTRERISSLVQKGLHVRGSAVLDGNEGEKLDGCLRVVGLEEDQGGYEERRQDGGEKTGLLEKKLSNEPCVWTLEIRTKTSKVSISSAKSEIMSSSWLRIRSWMKFQPSSGLPPYSSSTGLLPLSKLSTRRTVLNEVHTCPVVGLPLLPIGAIACDVLSNCELFDSLAICSSCIRAEATHGWRDGSGSCERRE